MLNIIHDIFVWLHSYSYATIATTYGMCKHSSVHIIYGFFAKCFDGIVSQGYICYTQHTYNLRKVNSHCLKGQKQHTPSLLAAMPSKCMHY